MQRWEREFAQVLVDVEDSLSATQRDHAVAKLRGYADAFRKLSGYHVAAMRLPAPDARDSWALARDGRDR
jgi:hypothetical protein